jgi:hypothetical protein
MNRPSIVTGDVATKRAAGHVHSTVCQAVHRTAIVWGTVSQNATCGDSNLTRVIIKNRATTIIRREIARATTASRDHRVRLKQAISDGESVSHITDAATVSLTRSAKRTIANTACTTTLDYIVSNEAILVRWRHTHYIYRTPVRCVYATPKPVTRRTDRDPTIAVCISTLCDV